MKIHLIAVGTKIPEHMEAIYRDYEKRFPKDCELELIEIPAGKRGKNADIERIVREEGEQMIAHIPKGALIITLDVPGKMYNSHELAKELGNWKMSGQDVALLVGGPEGLAESCKKIAHKSWSLSPLTLPYTLVRLIIAESLYRAWSIDVGHPYHRE